MLTPEDKRRAEEIFELLLEMPDGDREDFMARRCADQPELAAEVRLLMAHYQAAPPGFLQSPASDRTARETLEVIGPYQLQEVLGEGGMGVVYRAHQTSPVVRTVALKILKLGMDSQ